MPAISRQAASTIAAFGIGAFTIGEVSLWLLMGSSGTLWTAAAVALRFAEFVLPLVLLATLPGLRRLAALPGLAVKVWMAGYVFSIVSFVEMPGEEFFCLRFSGEAGSACMFVVGFVVAGGFWAIACLELYAFIGDVEDSGSTAGEGDLAVGVE